MTNEKFTDLEKSLMSDIISDGFFYDDLDDNFVGFAGDGLGKQERGALASLVKKGVVVTNKSDKEKGATYIWLTKDYTKQQIMKLFEIEE